MRRPRSGRRFGGAHGVLQHRCLLFPSRRTSPRERGALHPGRSLGGETNASPSAKGTGRKGRSHGSFDRSICRVCVNSGVDRLMHRFVRCDAAGPGRSSSQRRLERRTAALSLGSAQQLDQAHIHDRSSPYPRRDTPAGLDGLSRWLERYAPTLSSSLECPESCTPAEYDCSAERVRGCSSSVVRVLQPGQRNLHGGCATDCQRHA